MVFFNPETMQPRTFIEEAHAKLEESDTAQKIYRRLRQDMAAYRRIAEKTPRSPKAQYAMGSASAHAHVLSDLLGYTTTFWISAAEEDENPTTGGQ